MTWSNVMALARKRTTEHGIRHAVCGYYFADGRGWRYYVLTVGSKPWENAKAYAPRERLTRYGL